MLGTKYVLTAEAQTRRGFGDYGVQQRVPPPVSASGRKGAGQGSRSQRFRRLQPAGSANWF
jgi:hypothetical protein